MLGPPSGKFDFKMFYSKPPSSDIPIEFIVSIGWGDEFDDRNMLFKKEMCTVNVGKDGKKDRTMTFKELLYLLPEEELP